MASECSDCLDYHDAADRHWRDAHLLIQWQRFANADQSFGFFTECALKYIMYKNGMELASGKPKEKLYRSHIEQLWGYFTTFMEKRDGGSYISAMGYGANPFSDWSVAQRYWNSRCIVLEKVESHRAAAQSVFSILSQAILDGRLK